MSIFKLKCCSVFATHPATKGKFTSGMSLSHSSHTSYPSHASYLDTTQWLYDAPTGLLTKHQKSAKHKPEAQCDHDFKAVRMHGVRSGIPRRNGNIYANGHGTAYTYTPAGQLASRIWARGITTSYAYDGYSQLTGIQYSDNTQDISLAYDALGRVVSVMDASGTRSFNHTLEGLPLSDTLTAGGLAFNLTEKYDTLGRSEGYVLSNLTAGAEAMITETMQTYDIADRLGSVAVSGVGAFDYDRLPGSDLVQTLAMPNGVTRETLYEPYSNLPVTVSHTNAAGTVLTRRMYDYDAVGHLTNRGQFRLGDETDLSGVFTYNARSELTNAVIGANAYAYAFDTIGNRLSATENAAETSYLSNPLNQYTAITAEPLTFEPQYDLDGNQTLIRTSTGIWHVSYNAENRPICFSNESAVVEMGYDYQGRRFEYKEKVSGIATRHERYLYRGYLQLAALDLLATTNVIHTIVWDPTEPVATRPLLLQTSTGWFTYSFDQVKNVTELFDANGAIAATYDYSPFGEIIASTGSAVSLNPLTFSSEISDTILGLIYYNFRPYNPLDGRWISRDPIGERGGVNYYLHLNNSAIKGFDSLGLKPSFCNDECSPEGSVSDFLLVGIYAGPMSPNEALKSDALIALANAVNSMPTGLSYTAMVEWLMKNVVGLDITKSAVSLYVKMIHEFRPTEVYIFFEGRKCKDVSCCFGFYSKLAKTPCKSTYKCNNGPLMGNWPPNQTTGVIGIQKLTECYREAQKAFSAGRISCD